VRDDSVRLAGDALEHQSRTLGEGEEILRGRARRGVVEGGARGRSSICSTGAGAGDAPGEHELLKKPSGSFRAKTEVFAFIDSQRSASR
jgi:hypothetical protein